jgi:hypothetical protein
MRQVASPVSSQDSPFIHVPKNRFDLLYSFQDQKISFCLYFTYIPLLHEIEAEIDGEVYENALIVF